MPFSQKRAERRQCFGTSPHTSGERSRRVRHPTHTFLRQHPAPVCSCLALDPAAPGPVGARGHTASSAELADVAAAGPEPHDTLPLHPYNCISVWIYSPSVAAATKRWAASTRRPFPMPGRSSAAQIAAGPAAAPPRDAMPPAVTRAVSQHSAASSPAAPLGSDAFRRSLKLATASRNSANTCG